MARKMEHPNEICSMCGKPKSQALHLLQGVYGYVCNQCIEEAHEMLSTYAEQERKLREHQEHMDATPSEIKAYLDQYVIGQMMQRKLYPLQYITITRECIRKRNQMLRLRSLIF